MSRLFFILTLVLLAGTVHGQFLRITDIEVTGNKRTKDFIVIRDLDIRPGDRIQQSQLAQRLDVNRNLLLRTGLYTDATVNVKDWDTESDEIIVSVEVREGPMILPVPIFELADRNFNVWINEFGASLKRVNYGADVLLMNAWGFGERFRISGQLGYTPKVAFSGLLPFMNFNQAVRLEFDLSYSTNREVAMLTQGNILRFFQKDEEIIFKRQEYRLGLLIRQNAYIHHAVRMGYINNWVDPELTSEVNPDFFLNGRDRQEFVFAEYEFRIDYRDLPVFPRKGWRFEGRVRKDGFGINDHVSATYLRPLFEINHPLNDRFATGVILSGQVGLQRNQQPYYNYRALGYGESFVRGYELYVVDGLDFFLVQANVNYRIFSKMINWKKLMPVKSLKVMPLQVFLMLYYDTGYVNDPFYSEGNPFDNRWTHGGGVALNFLVYNTFTLRVEGSINHLGEKGIFLHSNKAF